MPIGYDSDQINNLIANKQIEEAKAILRQSSDPAAKSWLERLEQTYPTPGVAPIPLQSVSDLSTRKRGGCLMAWLVFASIVNPLLLLYYLYDGNGLAFRLGLPGWGMPILIMLVAGIIVCLYGLWTWKQWAIRGYIGIGIITFFVNLALLGLNPAALGGAFGGLIGIGIFWYVVRDYEGDFQ